jgi:hypothetical protein
MRIKEKSEEQGGAGASHVVRSQNNQKSVPENIGLNRRTLEAASATLKISC